jgi:hypothetical protein
MRDDLVWCPHFGTNDGAVATAVLAGAGEALDGPLLGGQRGSSVLFAAVLTSDTYEPATAAIAFAIAKRFLAKAWCLLNKPRARTQ